MKKIRFILTFLLLSTTIITSQAQKTVRLKASAITYSHYDNAGSKWGKWGDRKDCSYLISISSGHVKIFNEAEESYDVSKADDKVTAEDGSSLYTYHCTNNKKAECNIILKVYPKGDMQFFIFDTNAQLAWYYDVTFVE